MEALAKLPINNDNEMIALLKLHENTVVYVLTKKLDKKTNPLKYAPYTIEKI